MHIYETQNLFCHRRPDIAVKTSGKVFGFTDHDCHFVLSAVKFL